MKKEINDGFTMTSEFSPYRAFSALKEISTAFDLQARTYRQDPSFPDLQSFITACLDGKFVPRLVNDPALRFLLGVVGANTTSGSLPEWMRERFKPAESPANFTIKYLHGWDLCSDAEALMAQAVTQGDPLLVNDSLLVKRQGRRTGLCVRSIATADGTFIQGNWYSPMDKEIKEKIDNKFDSGHHEAYITQGCWALIRAMESSQTAHVLVRSLQERGFWAL